MTLWVPVNVQNVVVHDPDDHINSAGRRSSLPFDPSSEATGFATFDVMFVDAAGHVRVSVQASLEALDRRT